MPDITFSIHSGEIKRNTLFKIEVDAPTVEVANALTFEVTNVDSPANLQWHCDLETIPTNRRYVV